VEERARGARLKSRFDLLVVMCLIDYVLLVLVDSPQYLGLIVVAPIFFTAVLAQRATTLSGWWKRLGRLLLLIGAILGLANGVTAEKTQTLMGVASLLFACVLTISFVAVYLHVLEESEVTFQTTYAALSCYLMVGLIFALVDLSTYIFGGSFFSQAGVHPPGDFAYFSFITMTTVGYGDLTPMHGFPRSLAVLEAVAGQMVLVTLVARTVASVSRQSWSDRRAQRRGETPDATAE
jgi:hypothetical protein